jgi:hypothetical protein
VEGREYLALGPGGAGIRGGIQILNVPQFKGHSNLDPILLPRMFLTSRDIRNEKSTRGCTNSLRNTDIECTIS